MGDIKEKPTVETTYPISHHLRELRGRIVKILLVILIFFIFCYWQSQYIYTFVTAPIAPLLSDNISLSMLKLTEGFVTELKMCFLAALFITMPFTLFQFWRFAAPGLYKEERRYLVTFVFSASFLFLAGAAFVYYIVFPLGMRFLTSYASGEWNISALLSVEFYLSFVLKLMLAFGVVFELPVIIYFLSKVGLVTTDMLKKYRRFAIVGIFILAAALTPPDVISQVAMAFPLILLYEVSIFITKFSGKKKAEEIKEVDIYG
ncbi:MAG: twin-arginine translocase subunit TatC [Deferribacteraceae bacterium]|nr:twin-arginine translocase subunit TatC [Deferribacteraceae bacterium]